MKSKGMKPKVGEIWLMDSFYTWGQCLVEIKEPLGFGGIAGCVLDAEGDNLYFEPQTNDSNYVWSFRESNCVRKVE